MSIHANIHIQSSSDLKCIYVPLMCNDKYSYCMTWRLEISNKSKFQNLQFYCFAHILLRIPTLPNCNICIANCQTITQLHIIIPHQSTEWCIPYPLHSHILKKQIKAQMRRKSKQIQDELVSYNIMYIDSWHNPFRNWISRYYNSWQLRSRMRSYCRPPGGKRPELMLSGWNRYSIIYILYHFNIQVC